METLLQNLAEIDTKIKAITDLDAPTAAQTAEFETLMGQRAGVETKITMAKAVRANEAKMKLLQDQEAEHKVAEERASRAVASARLTDRDTPSPVHTVAAAAQSAAPMALTSRSRCIPKSFTTGTVAERQDRAYSFGMFGLALLSMNVPGRFRNRMAEDWLDKHMAVHQSNNATGSHILIPEEFANDMIVLREQFGVARRLFRFRQMSSDTLVIPRRASGLTAYFVAEGSAGTASNKTFNDVRLTAKDLMVMASWSNQVAADASSIINFGDDLASEITYAFSAKEDSCGFNGDGTSTYGGITGCRVAIAGASAGIFTQASGSTWGAITLADFQNTVGLLPQYADTQRAGWLCHRTFYYGVMQKVELAAGGVTAMEVSTGDRRGRPLFLGYPVDFSQVFPSATATGAIPVMLGDFSLAGAFGDRQQEAIAFSDSAVIAGESTFERNQVAIRGVQRFDIVVHDVGSSSAAGPVVALKTGA